MDSIENKKSNPIYIMDSDTITIKRKKPKKQKQEDTITIKRKKPKKNIIVKDEVPIKFKKLIRYTGNISFRVELKNKTGTRKFIKTNLTIPLLTKREIKKMEQDEIARLLAESPYLSVKPIQQNIEKVIVRKPVNKLTTMPIKQAGAIELDGLIKNDEWCNNNGLCVPDWLMFKYNDKKSGLKKKVKNIDVIQYYATHSEEDDGLKVYSNNPNKDGYTIENILLFCKNGNLPVYILHNGRLIHHDRNEKEGHLKKTTPLVIEVKNGHLYPITKTEQIKSIVQIPHAKSVMTKKPKTDEDKDKEEKVKDDDILIFNNKYDNPLKYLLQKQREENTLQYPRKCMLKGGKLCSFRIENKVFISTEREEAVEEYCKYRNIKYTGQGNQSFINPHLTKFPSSYLNNEVADALMVKGVKNRTHIGFYPNFELDEEEEYDGEFQEEKPLPAPVLEFLQGKSPICLDINKAYRDVMENPPDDFMTFDFNSVVEYVSVYNKNSFGMWFVETDDMTLLHQTNWYSSTILRQAYKDKIKFKVKYFIKGKNQGSYQLREIIENIESSNPYNDEEWRKEKTPELIDDVKRFVKNMIKSISGVLGKTTSKIVELTCDTDIERVWESYFEKPKLWEKRFVFSQLEEEEDKPPLYCWGREREKIHISNNLPIYIQILDWANMKLHDLIKKTGGYENLLYRKTDYIMMRDVGQKLQPTEDVGGYKIDKPPSNYINHTYNRHINYYHYKPTKNRDLTITTSDDFDKVINRLEEGHSLMLDSRAGTGKSYIIKKVSEHFGEGAVRRLAFTNKASNNIEGQTLHKFFGIDKQSKLNLNCLMTRMMGVKVLCIDEISMLGKELWGHIYYVKKFFPDVVFLLCGEEAQLPPIEEDIFKGGYFNHPTILWLCDYTFASLELTEKCRYDRRLYNYLTDIKDGNALPERRVESYKLDDIKNGTNLCYTNKRRKTINKHLNNYYAQSRPYFDVVFKNEEDGEGDEKYRQSTKVYEGLPLLVFTKHTETGLIKNTQHIVESINLENGTFRIKDNEHDFIETDINTKFIMAYAMTIHKSQGDTIDGIVNIHEYEAMLNNKNLHYTAVSRGRSLENIKYFI